VAEYSQFLGCRVTVRYRVGEMLLSASGVFSADSGRSIFLEQHLEQRGARKYFRWEIPYPYIYRIEAHGTLQYVGDGKEELSTGARVETSGGLMKHVATAGAGESADRTDRNSSVIPFPQRPKTA
jgi:hypothetical protein